MRAWHSPAGFTLVEMLIATALMLAVSGAALSLMDRAQATFSAQPEVSDLQQRLRVAEGTLAHDIMMAGAGLSSGRAAGPLAQFLAPLVPYRRGQTGDDAVAGVFFRPDALSLLYIPSTIAQSAVDRVTDLGTELLVDALPNCGTDRRDQLCGFTEGMRVVLLAPSGAFVLATVEGVAGLRLRVRRGGGASSWGSRDGLADTAIAEVSTHTYSLKRDAATATFQLMHYDGFTTDRPVVDHVVGLAFEYFTDSEPLAPSMLQDGPWRADADPATRYDADLLRVRRVRVHLRVEAAARTMRGPASALFLRGGLSTSPDRFAPDLRLQFDVAPRNLNLGR